MSTAKSSSTVRAPYRSKVTLACDACRKRRVKCSGTAPCTYCAESMSSCVFDERYRGRRGPRPSKPAPKIVLHPLEPAILPAHRISAPIDSHAVCLDGRASTQNTVSRPLAATQISTPQQGQATASERQPQTWISQAHAQQEVSTQEQEPAHVNSEYGTTTVNLEDTTSIPLEDDPVVESRSVLLQNAESCKERFERMLSRHGVLSQHPSLSVDLLCHLIDLFYSYSHAQVKAFLSSSEVYSRIDRGEISLGLLLAMCAAGMRFSTHTVLRQTTASDELLANMARTFSANHQDRMQLIDNIRTVCILADYESRKCHGRAAWIDLCIGKGLVQVFKAQESGTEQLKASQAAENFLHLAEMTYSLGQINLQPTLVTTTCQTLITSELASQETPEDSLMLLCSLLVSINQLYSVSIFEHDPPPWKAESQYSRIRNQLEDFGIRQPSLITEPDEGSEESDEEEIVSNMCFLLFQCCVIVLNKHYLPIVELRKRGDQGPLDSKFQKVDFPFAPALFLQDKARRCESSARVVCRAVRVVLKQGGFFPFLALIGYVCMESAIVLINLIQREPAERKGPNEENLTLLLTVLTAVRRFYVPAQSWIDALQEIFKGSKTLTHEPEIIKAHFENYYCRFPNLPVPAFVPLDPLPTPDQSHDNVAPENNTSTRNASNHPSDVSQQQTNDTTPSWVAAYSDHLFQNMGTDSVDETEPLLKLGRLQSSQEKRDTEEVSSKEAVDIAPDAVSSSRSIPGQSGVVSTSNTLIGLEAFDFSWASVMPGFSPSAGQGLSPSIDIDWEALLSPTSPSTEELDPRLTFFS